ncbi:hypothetical protein D3C71_1992820 [compost metagenome]
MAALEAAWKKQPKEMRDTLGADFLDELKRSAQNFDQQRELAATGDGQAVDDLNDSVLGNTAQAAT